MEAPAMPPEVQPVEEQHEVAAYGLGWQIKSKLGGNRVRTTFARLRKSGGSTSAEVKVEAWLPKIGVKGLLTIERVPISSGRDRASLANRLTERTGKELDWRNIVDRLCNTVLSKEGEGRPVLRLGRLPVADDVFLISNLVEDGTATSVYGDGELGKSWLGLAAAVSMETGAEIVPGWAPLRRGRALYIDYETDPKTFNKRIQMIANGAGVRPPEILYLAADEPFADLLEQILQLVADEGIDLLVIDSVEAAMAGSRSEGGDLNEPASRMNKALRKIGRSAILIDHVSSMNAASKGLAGKAYGSIFKRNWVRLGFELKKEAEGSADNVTNLGLYCTKYNNGRRFDARGLRMEFSADAVRWVPEDIASTDLRAAGLPLRRRMELALGEESPLSEHVLAERCEATLSAIRVELSRNKGRFLRILDGRYQLAGQVAPDPGERRRARLEVVNAGAGDVPPLPE
jgi:hypothetical protein